MSKVYGSGISPILKEISDSLWEIDARPDDRQRPYEYSQDALASSTKIFMSVCMDRFWKLHEQKGTSIEDRSTLVSEMGSDMRNLIIKYLGVDMHDEVLK
jgi:hypothetical protein